MTRQARERGEVSGEAKDEGRGAGKEADMEADKDKNRSKSRDKSKRRGRDQGKMARCTACGDEAGKHSLCSEVGCGGCVREEESRAPSALIYQIHKGVRLFPKGSGGSGHFSKSLGSTKVPNTFPSSKILAHDLSLPGAVTVCWISTSATITPVKSPLFVCLHVRRTSCINLFKFGRR